MEELLARYLFHWTQERALWLGGKSLVWDARCAGIYAGFAVALVYHLLFCRNQTRLPSRSVMIAAAAFVVPMFVDVFTIHFQLRPPVNTVRYLTGTLFGISFCCMLYPAVRQLVCRAHTEAMLPIQRFFVLILLGLIVSLVTTWDTLAAYYLLESLSWIGFAGLALLIGAGVIRGGLSGR